MTYEKGPALAGAPVFADGRRADLARPQNCAIATEFTVEINRDLEGRYQVSVDGRVKWATYDEQAAIRLAASLGAKTQDPDLRDRMLGRAIGQSRL